MKIVQLTAENIKRLRAVHIEPDGSVVIVGGDNAQGKTSVLDSIAMALGGGRLIPEQPIHHGEDTASVTVELDCGLTVTRDWGPKGTKLTVRRNGQRAPLSRPQSVLDELVGSLSFDPLAFASKHPRQQYEQLCDLVGIDLAQYEAERAKLFEERTAVNRLVKQAQAVYDDTPCHDDAPDELVDVSGVSRQLGNAHTHNGRVDDIERSIERERDLCARISVDIEELEDQIGELRQRIAKLHVKSTESRARQLELMERLDERIDTEPLERQLSDAESINAKVRANQHRAEKEAEWLARQDESEALTQRIAALDNEVAHMLSQAKFPLPELSVSQGQVTYKGVGLSQASAAERLRVCVAIAAALNPQLRVMLIRDASLLDGTHMRLLAQLADEYDAQLWVERVGDGDDGAVIIEDGRVRR